MFVFDNVLDKDVTSYQYELYKSDQVTGSFPNYSLIATPTIYLSGESGSNVFSIAVENSTDVANIRYFGRVRTKDTSGNYSSYSPLVRTDQDNPLIGNQYLSSITAAKITAGTIGAHQIILSQAGPQTNIAAPANMAVLRSSDYDGNYNSNTSTWTTGTDGWIIAGDGYAEFSSASIRGGLKAESVYINADNRWRRNDTDTAVSDQFKVGSSTKYLYFDGTNLTFTGNLSAAGGTFSGNLSAAGGTFSGNLSAAGGTFSGNLSAAGGTFTGAISGGSIDIGGSDDTSFHVDSSGSMWLGASTYAAAPFKVSSTGDLNATSGSIAGWQIGTNLLSSAGGNIGLYADDVAGSLVAGTGANNQIVISSDASLSAVSSGIETTINSPYIFGGNAFTFIVKNVSAPLNAVRINSNTMYITTPNNIVGFDANGPYGIFTNLDIVSDAQVRGDTVYSDNTIYAGGTGVYYNTSNLPGSRFGMSFGWDAPIAAVSFIVDNNPAVDGWILPDGFYSDRRIKSNISPLANELLEKIYSIKTYEFDYNDSIPHESLRGKHDIGVIADELELLFPEIVVNKDDSDKYKQVLYIKTIPLLLGVIGDLNTRLKALEQQLDYNG